MVRQLVLSTGTTQNLVIGAGSGNVLTLLASAPERRTSRLPPSAARPSRSPPPCRFDRDKHHLRHWPGQVSTLNQLNTALAANDLQASISTTGQINIVTSNNAASNTIGTIGGSATAFSGLVAAAPVVDPNSQATRNSLVAQYNQVLQQINTTSQDSSFNGINLLNGDTLNLTFDETGASKLAITGVTFNDAGLGSRA